MFIKEQMKGHTFKTPIEEPFEQNPLGYVTQPVIQHGILECYMYDAYEVSAGGHIRPGYLQAEEESDTVTIFASDRHPLSIVFSEGYENDKDRYKTANKSYIKKLKHEEKIQLTESSYIYAEVDGYDDNLIRFGALPANINVTYSLDEPEEKYPEDRWFDMKNNIMKYWAEHPYTGEGYWETEIKVFIGKIGVGKDNYIYTMQSWYPNKAVADIWNKHYPASENPYMYYDGVSFVTDGKYVAQNAPEWADDETVVEAVVNNPLAMQAIVNSATAMQAIRNSETAMQVIVNSETAMQAIRNNMVSTGNISYNTNRYNTVSELSDGNFYFLVEGRWSNIRSSFPGSIRVDSGTYERTGFSGSFQEFLWPVYNKVEVNPRGGRTLTNSARVELWYLKF